MKKVLIVGAAAALVVGLAWLALAQEAGPPVPGKGPGPGMEAAFKEADVNGDGLLSFDEFKVIAGKMRARAAQRPGQGGPHPGHPPLTDQLMQADENGDKQVTPEEFKAAFPESGPERFSALDKDQDGVLTLKDAPRGPHGPAGPGPRKGQGPQGQAGPRKGPGPGHGQGPQGGQGPRPGVKALLESGDADNDGKLTYEEVKKIRPGMPEEAFKRWDTDKDGVITKKDIPAAGPKGQKAGAPDRPKAKKGLRDADTNGDGKVSLEEAQKAIPGMTEERFKQRDRNGDGYITKEDRPEKKTEK